MADVATNQMLRVATSVYKYIQQLDVDIVEPEEVFCLSKADAQGAARQDRYKRLRCQSRNAASIKP